MLSGLIPTMVRRKQSRVIFCPNQISTSVARDLIHRDTLITETVVIYWPDRCDVTKLLSRGIACLPYSRTSLIAHILILLLFTRVEALLPHRRLGRLVNWLTYLCSSTSLIDDGLDTLRDVPRNVDPQKFKQGAKFYTFKYGFPLGKWLNRFTIDKVANFSTMADSERSLIDLRNIRRLVIESPPLNHAKEEIGVGTGDCLLVTHSNVNKRQIKNWTGPTISGADVALERSLKDFDGEVVVGESMVAVFALINECPKYRLTICLLRNSLPNLTPLAKLIQSRPFAQLNLY